MNSVTQPVSTSPIRIPISQPGFCHVVGFGVCHVDLPVIVEGDSAGAPELGPGGHVISLLVEDLDAAVAPISHEDPPARVDIDGVERTELAWSVPGLSPGHNELPAAVVLYHTVVADVVVAVRDEDVPVFRNGDVARGGKVIRATTLLARRAERQEHLAARA